MVAALAFMAVTASCLVPHADNMSVEAGAGQHVDIAGVGWEYRLGDDCVADPEKMQAGVLFRLDGLRGKDAGRRILDTSFTPFLRYEVGRPFGDPVFVEGGIGAHFLSHTRANDNRQFSTAFQFGEFAGAGVQFGEHRENSVALRVQHISNGGIKRPNDGVTAVMLAYIGRSLLYPRRTEVWVRTPFQTVRAGFPHTA